MVSVRTVRFLIVPLALLFVLGCAGFGIVATSDPLAKLNDAEDLFMRQARPLPAERLIFEAMEIYQEQGDQQGLGHAHREYGDLLLSPAVVKWEQFYRKNGFRDRSITYDNRFAKSAEYFTKALGYYQDAEGPLRKAGRFDALTNLYFNMAWSHYRLGDRGKACSSYDRSLEAYSEIIRRNPAAKPYVPSGYGSYADLIALEKRRAGCA